MITWNFWLPAVFVIFSFRFVPFGLTEYVMFVFVFGIPVFISVRLKNGKVKTLGMAIQVRVPDTRRISDLTGYRYVDDFLPTGDTRTQPKLRRVRDGYFFLPVGNPTGTQYFTITIILRCEQVKICSFCYINYDLF
jgi:hypothetical protein